MDSAANISFPDVLALAVDSTENMLCCVYSDHSLYIWDMKNLEGIFKKRSFLFHSRAIWDIDVGTDNKHYVGALMVYMRRLRQTTQC